MNRRVVLVGGLVLALALLGWQFLPQSSSGRIPVDLGRSVLAQSPEKPAALSEGALVTINDDYSFSPSTLVVAPGTTVTWVNKGQGVHAVTSFDRSWDSGPIAPGDRWSFTFPQPRTFPYYCHPGMEGRVIVGDVPEGNVPAPEKPESRGTPSDWGPPADFNDMATIMDRMMGPGGFEGMRGAMGGFAPRFPQGTAPGNQGWGGMMGSGGMMGGSAPSTPNNGWGLPWGQRGFGGMMGR